MQKKYIVRLSDEERTELLDVIKKLKGTSQKVRRAQILLKADADGPSWTDAAIADAFGCRTKTVENIRQRFVENGFRETLDGKKRQKPPTDKILDGEQEAKVIALRLGPPPKGYANWSLRCWLARLLNWELLEALFNRMDQRCNIQRLVMDRFRTGINHERNQTIGFLSIASHNNGGSGSLRINQKLKE